MTNSKRILIVEDDLDWREEIAEVLSGYELIAAGTVGEACQRINEANQENCVIDLVILDLGLSQTTGIDSGLTVLAHLRDQSPNVACIVFTGRTLPMGKAASLFQEYDIFEGLEKPGDMPRLAKVVRSALAQTERQKSEASGESERDVKGSAVPEFNRGYALIIGVGGYTYSRFTSLPATVRDAQALSALLTDPARCGYPPANVRVLTSEQATAANIRVALRALAESTNHESTVFVYFSGHGGRALENGVWRSYLCPREANPDDLAHTAIPGDEFSALLAAIPARKLLVMLDACHASGSAELKAVDGTLLWKASLPDSYYEALSQGSGRVVIASSKEDQFSYVCPQSDLSLFTHHMLQALSGKAAVRGDGLIHVLDVFHYVNEAVQTDEPKQVPILKAKDLDLNFPIALDQGGKGIGPTLAVPDIAAIRERIVRDPIAGAKALSNYLATHPEWAGKRDEVDLKRADLGHIQHDLDLFGPNPSDQAARNRAIYFLLRVCLELERPEQ